MELLTVEANKKNIRRSSAGEPGDTQSPIIYTILLARELY